MTSFVNEGVRVFNTCQDGCPLASKSSAGHIKRIPSETDSRAWTYESEKRRSHILKVVKGCKRRELRIGRYIPLETIIQALLFNKGAQVEKMKKVLTAEQKAAIYGEDVIICFAINAASFHLFTAFNCVFFFLRRVVKLLLASKDVRNHVRRERAPEAAV